MDLSDLTYSNSSLLCPYSSTRVPGGLPLALSLHTFDILLSLSVVLLNLFIAWALWSRRRFHRLHSSRSLWFVLNLVVGAILGGSFELATLTSDTICPFARLLAHNEAMCVLKLVISLLQWMININMHAVIALDRYLLIVHSLRYRDLVTSSRALAIIAVAWLLSFAGAASILVDNNWKPGVRCVAHDLVRSWHVLAVQLPMNILVLVIVVATHLRIREAARRSAARHGSIHIHAGAAGAAGAALPGASKSARVLYLVIGCYVLSFCPVQLVLVLRACSALSGSALYVSMLVSWPLSVVSLLVNPLLYTWKNAHLRADLKVSWALVVKRVKRVLRIKHSQQDQQDCPAQQRQARF